MADVPQDFNADYAETVRKTADDSARNAYNQAMLALEGEKIALQKAQQAWKETVDKAGLTGYFEGAATMPTQQYWASTFGTWGAPQQGQQTLEGQQQQWQQAYNQAQQFGQWYAPGTMPTAGQQTLGANEQNYTQWLRAAQEARQNQALQQQTAQNYLQLLSQLRGPADWAKYQQVLGSTPGGMRDLVSAAMGQYIPGGGATTGQAPQAADLQTLQQQVAGGGAGGQPSGQDQMGQLPAPNQIAPQAWRNLAPSQQQMLMGAYEAQGWHRPDVEALFAQSLPKYAVNAPTGGTWRLAA